MNEFSRRDLLSTAVVAGAATDEAMIAAVSREVPDLIIAPMLKIAIPEEVWSRHHCLIVHPGIKGDRGASSLDWAIANHEKIWGVTILEAADEFDAIEWTVNAEARYAEIGGLCERQAVAACSGRDLQRRGQAGLRPDQQ